MVSKHRKLFLAAPLPLGVTAAGSSTCLIWQSLMQDAHPDINPTGICVSGWNRPSDLSLVKRKVAGSWKTVVAFSKGPTLSLVVHKEPVKS